MKSARDDELIIDSHGDFEIEIKDFNTCVVC